MHAVMYIRGYKQMVGVEIYALFKMCLYWFPEAALLGVFTLMYVFFKKMISLAYSSLVRSSPWVTVRFPCVHVGFLQFLRTFKNMLAMLGVNECTTVCVHMAPYKELASYPGWIFPPCAQTDILTNLRTCVYSLYLKSTSTSDNSCSSQSNYGLTKGHRTNWCIFYFFLDVLTDLDISV